MAMSCTGIRLVCVWLLADVDFIGLKVSSERSKLFSHSQYKSNAAFQGWRILHSYREEVKIHIPSNYCIASIYRIVIADGKTGNVRESRWKSLFLLSLTAFHWA